jgi:hypothetical protein
VKELRRRLLAAFEFGTAEELAVALELVHLLSIHPKTREAGPDFAHRTGSALKHDTNQMSARY